MGKFTITGPFSIAMLVYQRIISWGHLPNFWWVMTMVTPITSSTIRSNLRESSVALQSPYVTIVTIDRFIDRDTYIHIYIYMCCVCDKSTISPFVLLMFTNFATLGHRPVDVQGTRGWDAVAAAWALRWWFCWTCSAGQSYRKPTFEGGTAGGNLLWFQTV
jgi:hypothetical protein